MSAFYLPLAECLQLAARLTNSLCKAGPTDLARWRAQKDEIRRVGGSIPALLHLGGGGQQPKPVDLEGLRHTNSRQMRFLLPVAASKILAACRKPYHLLLTASCNNKAKKFENDNLN